LHLRDISPLSRRSSPGQRYSGGVRSSPGNITVIGSPRIMGEDDYMFDGKRGSAHLYPSIGPIKQITKRTRLMDPGPYGPQRNNYLTSKRTRITSSSKSGYFLPLSLPHIAYVGMRRCSSVASLMRPKHYRLIGLFRQQVLVPSQRPLFTIA
jgi:hypothetical protein